MKIIIERCNAVTETVITVKCGINTDGKTEEIIQYLKLADFTVIAVRNREKHKIPLNDVFYIECVDEKTFIYLRNEVFESEKRLYEWEEILKETSFIRTGKSIILNTDKLKSVRSLVNGKLEATLTNGEKTVINRRYVRNFKNKFGI